LDILPKPAVSLPPSERPYLVDRGLRSAIHRHTRRTVDNYEQRFGVECSTLSHAKAALSRRRLRQKLFADARFADGPAWEMLVDLYVNQIEGKELCVGSLCVTAGVPMTNAVRIVGKLLDAGLIRRKPDVSDRRRCLLSLDEGTRSRLDTYFSSH
jgi:DNA-binding MarR family transcriptional regulator